MKISPLSFPLQNPPLQICLFMACPCHSKTSSPLLTMAILSLWENDNKENILPFSSKQPTIVFARSCFSSTAKRRRTRYPHPLEDITHLFNFNPLLDSSSISASLESSQAERRKRRAEADLDSFCKNKMTNLLHSSRNFR